MKLLFPDIFFSRLSELATAQRLAANNNFLSQKVSIKPHNGISPESASLQHITGFKCPNYWKQTTLKPLLCNVFTFVSSNGRENACKHPDGEFNATEANY